MIEFYGRQATLVLTWITFSMENISTMPLFAARIFKLLPAIFRDKHKRAFTWMTLLIALGVANYKLKGMASYGPSYLKEYRFRRFLTAAYWNWHVILIVLSHAIINILPPPEDSTVYVICDGSKKDKRGFKHPFNQKGKMKANQNWFWGTRFVVLMLQWGNFRIPIDMEILYPKTHKKYVKENALFRKMLGRLELPSWTKRSIILADAGFAAKDNVEAINTFANRLYQQNNITCGFVFSVPKTWRLSDGKSLKDLAKHTPHRYYQRVKFSSITESRTKSYWMFTKQIKLRHIGDVTVVLSKKRRNAGPRNVKVIVTNLSNLTARQVAGIYQRRFMIEVLFKELKSGLGLGKQQVTKNDIRVKNSFGMSVIAYLFILRAQYQDIQPGKSWSIFKLQENLRLRVMKEQIKSDRSYFLKKLKKAA